MYTLQYYTVKTCHYCDRCIVTQSSCSYVSVIWRDNVSLFPVIFRAQNLEWQGYQRVKKFEDMFSRFDAIHERDGRTVGRADTAPWHRPH